MIRSLWAAASGMNAYQASVDVVANNLANVNTVGYKQVEASFADLLYQLSADAPVLTGGMISVGSGVRLAAATRQFTQGMLDQTGRELDIAIQGNGFIPLTRPDGSIVYTRDGSLMVDGNGYLISASGYLVGPNIAIPQNAKSVRIMQDGYIQVTMPDNSTQQAGRLYLANFANPAGLKAIGDNLFLPTANSGAVTVQAPGAGGTGTVHQGFIERSNVDIAQQMVNLITGQRAYELSSRVIRTADEMLDMANNIRR